MIRPGLLLSLLCIAGGCASPRLLVATTDSCKGAPACDWVMALRQAQARGCGDELLHHWSAAVRDACLGVEEESVRFGNNDIHGLDVSNRAEGLLHREQMRPDLDIEIPATENLPEITSARDVWVTLNVGRETLAGVDQGEWGGALLLVRERGPARVVARGVPVEAIVEHGDRVFVFISDFYRSAIYEWKRQGRTRIFEFRFRLPGRLLSVSRESGKLHVFTDGGLATIDATGNIQVPSSHD